LASSIQGPDWNGKCLEGAVRQARPVCGTLTGATRAALDEAGVLARKMVAETGFGLGRFGEAYQALGQAMERLGERLGQAASPPM
jgi:hypothetical protein